MTANKGYWDFERCCWVAHDPADPRPSAVDLADAVPSQRADQLDETVPTA